SPAPVSTRTLQRSSISSAFMTWSISAASAGLIALRFSGRFIITQAMPLSNSTSTVLPPGAEADERSAVELVVKGLLFVGLAWSSVLNRSKAAQYRSGIRKNCRDCGENEGCKHDSSPPPSRHGGARRNSMDGSPQWTGCERLSGAADPPAGELSAGRQFR